jgi:hypothetical protein
MDPNKPNTKLSSAWTFADKHYAPVSEKFRDSWDRIFAKKTESAEDKSDTPNESKGE